MSHFSAAQRRRVADEVQTCGVMGTRRRRDDAVQAWVKPTEGTGVAEEAHRRWPEGRCEHGREQGKG